jgi:hypothetical protein
MGEAGLAHRTKEEVAPVGEPLLLAASQARGDGEGGVAGVKLRGLLVETGFVELGGDGGGVDDATVPELTLAQALGAGCEV